MNLFVSSGRRWAIRSIECRGHAKSRVYFSSYSAEIDYRPPRTKIDDVSELTRVEVTQRRHLLNASLPPPT